MMTEENEPSFEEAFARLEEILNHVQTRSPLLEEAITLYEEADLLIRVCQKRLTAAEQKIEVLVKNRQGQLALGPDQRPQTQKFN